MRDLSTIMATDYSLDVTMVTIPSGQMKAVTVSGMADGSDEDTEIFEISLASDATYTIGTPSKATVYIRDIARSEAQGM